MRLSQLFSDTDIRPDEYQRIRERVWVEMASTPEFKKLNAIEKRAAYETVWEPDRPLLGTPRKELGPLYHPALKTPMYLGRRFMGGFDPTGIYEAAASPVAGMTPQQKAVEAGMWGRLGPQGRGARLAADIGPTVAGIVASVGAGPLKGLGAGIQALKGAAMPTVATRAAQYGRAALTGKEALGLGALEATGWGTGFAFMEGLRGISAGLPPEEAARRAVRTGVTVGIFAGGISALATGLASIKSVPEVSRLAALVAEQRISPDKAWALASRKMGTATTKKAKDAWSRLWIAMEQIKRDKLAGIDARLEQAIRTKTATPWVGGHRTILGTPVTEMDLYKWGVAFRPLQVGPNVPLPAVQKTVWAAQKISVAEGMGAKWNEVAETALKAAGVDHLFRDSTVGAASNDYFRAFSLYWDWLGKQGLDTAHKVGAKIQHGHNVQLKGRIIGGGLRDFWRRALGKRPFTEDRWLSIYDDVVSQTDDVARAAAIKRLEVSRAELEALSKSRTWLDKAHRDFSGNAKGTGWQLRYRKNFWPRETKRPKGMSFDQYKKVEQEMRFDWGAKQSRAVAAARAKPGTFYERKLATHREWATHVRKYNLEPIVHPGEALDAYMNRTSRAVAWRKTALELMGMVDDQGKALVSVQRKGANWVEIMDPEFSRFAHQLTGGKFAQRLYADPKVGKILNALFVAPEATGAATKAMNQGLSLYKQMLFFNPMIHTKNIFSDFLDECNFNIYRVVKGYMRGRQIWLSMDDALEHALDAGLELGGGSTLAALRTARIPGPWGTAFWSPLKYIDFARKTNQEWMFGKVIRYSQLATFEMKVAQLLNKNPGAPIRAVEAAAAHFVNDLYGTLPPHWINVTAAKYANWAFLARNWTFSNIDLVLKAATRRGLGSATMAPAQMRMIQHEYTKHLLKGVFGLFMQAELLTYGATAVFGEKGAKHIWDYPMDEWFNVGTGATDSKGREVKFSLPLFAYIKDLISWSPVKHPWTKEAFPTGRTLYNKLHPAWKVSWESLTDYSIWQRRRIGTPGAPPHIQKLERAKYFAEGAIPLLRPIKHVASGTPQPGVKEPRLYPALAYLSGNYLIHSWRGTHGKLVESLARFSQEKVYERLTQRKKVFAQLAKGDYAEAYAAWLMEPGPAKNPSAFRDLVYRYLCPTLATFRGMAKWQREQWFAGATQDQIAELKEALAEETERVRAVFHTDARKAMGESQPK